MGYRVLVKPDNIEEKTEGGIIIPEAERSKHLQAQQSGVIVALGLDAWSDYSQAWAKIGDRVLFARHQGQPLTGADDEEYRMINDEQVTAVIDGNVDLTDFKSREAYAA